MLGTFFIAIWLLVLHLCVTECGFTGDNHHNIEGNLLKYKCFHTRRLIPKVEIGTAMQDTATIAQAV